jgi:hypothetical protein
MRAEVPVAGPAPAEPPRRQPSPLPQEGPWLALLLLIYAASRLLVSALGVHFDLRLLDLEWQLASPDLLRDHLTECMLYMHSQPPLFNLVVGLALKGFPNHVATAIHAVYVVTGALTTVCLFLLLRHLHVRRGLAFILTAVFMLSPACLLYENALLYDYLNLGLLVASAYLLARFATQRTLASGLAFFSTLSAICLLRSMFHLGWALLVVAGLVLLAKRLNWPSRRTMLLAALPLLLVVAFYAKNAIMFGSFSASSWLGMSLAKITLNQLSPPERQALAASGVVSSVGACFPFQDLVRYPAAISNAPLTGIAVLDQRRKPSGYPNFNNPAYIAISRQFKRDAQAVMRRHPSAYLKGVATAWLLYFRPADEYGYVRLNIPPIRPWLDIYNVVVNGRILPRPDAGWLQAHGLPQRSSEFVAASVPRLCASLLLMLPALMVFALRRCWRELRAGGITPATLVLAYMVYTILFVTFLGNMVEVGENNRFRLLIDPFYLAILGLVLTRLFPAARELDA